MEAQLKRYNYNGGILYFKWNFAAGIEYEDLTGKDPETVETNRDVATFLYCGTKEGMLEIGKEFTMTFKEWTHKVDHNAVYDIFGKVEAKKKRRRWWRIRKKSRTQEPTR